VSQRGGGAFGVVIIGQVYIDRVGGGGVISGIVGFAPPGMCVGGKCALSRTHKAYPSDGGRKYVVYPILVQESCPFLFIGDGYKFHQPLNRCEIVCVSIGLVIGGDKPHVAGGELYECFHIGMASYRRRLPRCVLLYREDEDCGQKWGRCVCA
jgi:hypothetical protein